MQTNTSTTIPVAVPTPQTSTITGRTPSNLPDEAIAARQKPFPEALHALVSYCHSNAHPSDVVVRWNADGYGFVVLDRGALQSDILPLFFQQGNWTWLERQLTLYGFKRDEEGGAGVYRHEGQLFHQAAPDKANHIRLQGAAATTSSATERSRQETLKEADPETVPLQASTAASNHGDAKDNRLQDDTTATSSAKNCSRQETVKEPDPPTTLRKALTGTANNGDTNAATHDENDLQRRIRKLRQRAKISKYAGGGRGMSHDCPRLPSADIDRSLHQSLPERLAHIASLETLCISRERIGDMGAFNVANALRQHDAPNLRRIDLSYNEIGGVGASWLADAIASRNTSVPTLNLEGNQIANEGAAAVSRMLQQPSSRVHVVNLNTNGIGDEGAASIADALKTNKTLEALKLDFNQTSDVGAGLLVDGLEHNNTLLDLHLRCMQLSHEGLSRISAALRHDKNVQFFVCGMASSLEHVLSVQFRRVNDAVSFLSSCLRSTRATTLHIEHCGLRDVDLLRIPPTLLSLQKLFLSGNEIGDDGVTALVTSGILSNATNLQLLDLSRNRLGDVGVAKLAEKLVENRSLCEVCLCCNQFGDKGVIELANALGADQKPALSKLDLFGNAIGNDGAIHIAKQLLQQPANQHANAVNSTATSSLSSSSSSSCASSRSASPSLEYLHLGRNRIGDEGAMAIADALEHNISLRELYLAPNNTMGELGKGAIYNVLLVKPTEVNIDILFKDE